MNIYDFAIQKELEGEAFYRSIADKSSHAWLKQIFLLLAEEEVKHRIFLERLQEGDSNPELSESNTLDSVKKLFSSLEKSLIPAIFIGDESALYSTALILEDESSKLYAQKALEASSPAQATLFQRLAAEERMHATLIQGILQFLENPKIWLENAEWSHLGSEY
jgi:rubrerythrin